MCARSPRHADVRSPRQELVACNSSLSLRTARAKILHSLLPADTNKFGLLRDPVSLAIIIAKARRCDEHVTRAASATSYEAKARRCYEYVTRAASATSYEAQATSCKRDKLRAAQALHVCE